VDVICGFETTSGSAHDRLITKARKGCIYYTKAPKSWLNGQGQIVSGAWRKSMPPLITSSESTTYPNYLGPKAHLIDPINQLEF